MGCVAHGGVSYNRRWWHPWWHRRLLSDWPIKLCHDDAGLGRAAARAGVGLLAAADAKHKNKA